jgi:hypothetical protein
MVARSDAILSQESRIVWRSPRGRYLPWLREGLAMAANPHATPHTITTDTGA